ncbi:alternative ribosome rescue aminoacyl-tRNA hydrolase ArfB [Eionea flava]
MSSINIHPSEITCCAIRAQGAGGQHVNKTSTAIHLQFVIGASSLSEVHKKRLAEYPDYRISKDGIITIKAQRFRSQDKNRQDAIERLQALIEKAIHIPKSRRPTRPSKSAKRKRTDQKVKRGSTKQLRKKPSFD